VVQKKPRNVLVLRMKLGVVTMMMSKAVVSNNLGNVCMMQTLPKANLFVDIMGG